MCWPSFFMANVTVRRGLVIECLLDGGAYGGTLLRGIGQRTDCREELVPRVAV